MRRISKATSSCGSGATGESYPGIRKDEVHVGGRITLADRVGPFGNPTSDSARTMVTPATTRRWWSCSRRARLDERHLVTSLDVTARRMSEFTGGRQVSAIDA